MGTGNSKYGRVFLFLAVICHSCHFGPDEPVPVVSLFRAEPDSGYTTTRFEFDATQSLVNSIEENPVLLRFDWQGDGTWDQDYTSASKLVHRFLRPGKYTVRMEARNTEGSRDTSSITVVVKQGYSAPYALFTVKPDSANRFAVFHFDASASFDDEDSSGLLTYRWDFDGNGSWDTEFSGVRTADYLYPGSGRFSAGVEVMDPTGRSSFLRKPVTVDLLNDSIRPDFTIAAGFSTVTTVILFDASKSHYLESPDKSLFFSWDVMDDGLWEVENDTSPILRQVIRKVGWASIRLRVTDDRGLYRDKVLKLEIFPENASPEAVVFAGSHVGNPHTEYFFSSYGTSDRESSVLDLRYRWDVNEDGEWDPVYDNQRQITCHFMGPGKHVVRLKVIDDHDNTSLAEDSVTVFAGDHETGLLADKRNFIPDYYGIVKIGNLWWMQENIRIEIEPGPNGTPPPLIRWCYKGEEWNCRAYGGLYNYEAVNYPQGGICPDGWHLPTRAEFQDMVDCASPGSMSPLLYGGSSEMHIHLPGYIGFDRKSTGQGSITQFWLADRSVSGQPYVWYIDRAKGENRAVITSKTAGYSVRCVKSDQ